jgi:hypothetical protein
MLTAKRFPLLRILLLRALPAFVFLALLGARLPVPVAHADVTDYVDFFSTMPSITSDSTATFQIYSDMGYDLECKLDDASFAPCNSTVTLSGIGKGNHTFTAHAIDGSNPESTATISWRVTKPATLSNSGNITGATGIPITIPAIHILDTTNDTLTVKLVVPSGSLHLSASTGLTFTGSQTGSTLQFTGTRSQLNTALATLTYTASSAGSTTLQAYILGSDSDENSILHGKMFQVVHTDSNVDWNQARMAAEATSYGGQPGYLASVEDLSENAFISARLSQTAWLGGSDQTSEGDWTWMSGPKNNTSFWSGGSGGSAVGGAFSYWNFSMPDNYNNEDCLEIYSGTPMAKWNDQNCSNLRRYYVVAYGDGVTVPYIGSTEVTITAVSDTDGDGLADTQEYAGPNSGDANNDGQSDASQKQITSIINSVTNSYTVLANSGDCQNLSVSQQAMTDLEKADPIYSFPAGLMTFTLVCPTPGMSTTVKQYFYGMTDTTLVARKYDPRSKSYALIENAQVTRSSIAGQSVLLVSYEIQDGGALDQDGVANGTIIDPSGPALLSPQATPAPTVLVAGVPNTGLAPMNNAPILAGVLAFFATLGGVSLVWRRLHPA